MKWKRLAGRHQFHETRVDDLDSHTCRGVWEFVLTRVLPVPAPTAWTFVMVQVWGDSGRLIVFPAATAHMAVDEAGCQVICATFRQRWNDLIQRDLSDREFTRLATRELRAISQTVFEALAAVLAAEPGVWRSLARTRLKIACYDADDHKAFATSEHRAPRSSGAA